MRALHYFLIGFFLFSVPSFATSISIQQIVENDYESLHSAARALKNLDDGTTVYIAVGCSPLPIAAALESLHFSEQVVRIPLSEIFDTTKSDTVHSISSNQSRWLKAYFDYFLASALKKTPTSFVVFDYAQTGGTLPLIKDYFVHYFEKYNIPSESVTFVGFALPSVPDDEF